MITFSHVCHTQIETKNFRIGQSIPISAARLPWNFMTKTELLIFKFEHWQKENFFYWFFLPDDSKKDTSNMGCAAEEKFVGWEHNKGCENDRCCWNSIIPWFDIVTKWNKCCYHVRPNAAQDMQTQSRSIHDQIKRLDKIVTCYTLLEKIPKFLISFLNQISFFSPFCYRLAFLFVLNILVNFACTLSTSLVRNR